jgi:ectoine hydroxylase-related dioxygenase (phytanoyl-CoA dioxygenase family)
MNRQNDNVIEAFKILYGDDRDLIVNHDRFTFYRPTLSPGKPEYKTPYVYPNLHLDTDPQMYLDHYNIFVQKQKSLLYENNHHNFITENNYLTSKNQPIYQGIINLWENSYEDGGLHLVPKFHNNFEEWYYQKNFKTKPGDDTGFHFSASDPVDLKYVHTPLRIPLSAGSMAIWDKRLAHGSVPNNSNKGRLMQFIVVRPKDSFLPEVLEKRTKELKKIFIENDFIDKVKDNHIFW